MRSLRRRKAETNVSLFPFLAVLVCTMGALIVLLVMMVQQARVQANTVAEPTGPTLEELQDSLGDFTWRREILEQQRVEQTQKLADKRAELSHLEEHIQRLESRWKQLRKIANELAQDDQRKDEEGAATELELARLQSAINVARTELEAAKQDAAERKRSYAIVPYVGRSGTQRRPIYLECTENGVVLQPEGVLFDRDDFDGQLGPGNPLNSAMRAVREYWNQAGIDGNPYPLLVVRPGGALAYAAARAALNTWDDELGYELVEAETNLAFPPPDTTLRRSVEASVRVARQRQKLLARAMPSMSRSHRGGLVADSRGGFRPEYSGADDGDGGGRSSGRGSRDRGSRDRGTGERGTSERRSDGRDPLGPTPRSPGSRPGSSGGRSESEVGRPNGASPADVTGPYASGATASSSGAAGSSRGGSGGPAGADGGAAAGGLSRGFGLPRGGGGGGRGGSNWALKNSRGSAFTRPIALQCFSDRLILPGERAGQRRGTVIMLDSPMDQAIDQLVEQVQERIESWGIAVAGGYWKPVLNVEVAPGAEPQFQELQTVLRDSGIDLIRKR